MFSKSRKFFIMKTKQGNPRKQVLVSGVVGTPPTVFGQFESKLTKSD